MTYKTIASIAATALLACSGSSGGGSNQNSLQSGDACLIAPDARFRSVEKYEVGLGPNGPVMGYWTVVFEPNNRLRWHWSDIEEHMTYACEGAIVIAAAHGRQVTGIYDDTGVAGEVLMFDGKQYVAGDPPPELCEGKNPEGCLYFGCGPGERCEPNVGCNPSQCDCEGGSWVCTPDCGGGTCVPE
jgi:hypothetical protein